MQGKTFQLVGPAEYSYKEVAEFVSDVTLMRCTLVDYPVPLANFVGGALDMGIAPLLSKDMVEQLQEDVLPIINDPALMGFKDLGIDATSMDKVAFDWLHRFRPGGHFNLVKGYH